MSFSGAVWVYLLQAKDNQELQQNDGITGHYNPMDSLLNHSGSSAETNSRERFSAGSGNGGLSSYPSSANSSVLPWCSNGAESNFYASKMPENNHLQSPNLNGDGERRTFKNSSTSHQTNFATKGGSILLIDHSTIVH